MQDFHANLLFKAEPDATSFEQRLNAALGNSAWSLDRSLRDLGATVPGDSGEFSVEALRRYRNVVSIRFYAGDRSDYRPLVAAFAGCGAHLVKLSVSADDYNELELYEDGKRSTKKPAFLKKFQSLTLPDPSSDFIRAVVNRNFKRAESLLPQFDAAQLTLDDEALEILMVKEAAPITLHLIEAGALRHNRRVGQYASPLMSLAARWGNLAVLKAFARLGFDPYATDENGMTALHELLECPDPDAIEASVWFAELCAGNLSPMSPLGSPVWLAYERTFNTIGARIFRERGGLLIAPNGFYDELSREEAVNESVRHDDVETLKLHYQDEDRDTVLCTAVEHAAMSVISWMHARKPIDWFAEVTSHNGHGDDAPTAPLYEQLFLWSDGGNVDLVFFEHLIDGIASNANALDLVAIYIAGFSATAPLLRKLGQLGASFKPAPLYGGDEVSPLWRAVQEGHVDNARALLELGAPIPPSDDGEASFAEQAKDYRDDVDPARWEQLFSEFNIH